MPTLFRSARWPHLLGRHWQRLCGTPCIFLLCHSWACLLWGPFLDFPTFPSSVPYHMWLTDSSSSHISWILAGLGQWESGHWHEIGEGEEEAGIFLPLPLPQVGLQKELHLLLGSSSFWIGPLRFQILLGDAGLWSWLLHICLCPSLLKVTVASHHVYLQVTLLSMFGFSALSFPV